MIMNKFNKGKLIGVVAASLSAVSLMGVGFASWVINGAKSTDTNDITVNVEDVIDNRITISGATVTDPIIKFDANSNTSGDLLEAQGTNEDLEFSISYTITNNKKDNKFKVFAYITEKAKQTGESDKQAAFSAAVNTNKLIQMPDALNITKSDTNYSGMTAALTFSGTAIPTGTDATITEKVVGTTYTVSQKFKFNWGLAFANKNPVEVSSTDNVHKVGDSAETTKATADILKDNLTALRSANLSTFKITIAPFIVA